MSVGAKTLEQIRQPIEAEGGGPTQENPLKVTVEEGPARVEAEVSAFDTLGLALRALTVQGDNDAAPLETLAQTISERVTYLWEPLALIERDLEREQVQMRSAPPLVEEKAIEFYEGELMRRDGTPRMRLVRYRQENNETRRKRIPITLTQAAFRRLVDDLSAILGTPATE